MLNRGFIPKAVAKCVMDFACGSSPLTPGPRPVCGSPWVPHTHHEESGHPSGLQQSHLPHRRNPVCMSPHQAATQHRLHCLALRWLRDGEHTEASQLLIKCLLLFCSPTRMEQVMSALRSWALASIWKSALLWSTCRLRASRFRMRGSETPPVKSTSASVVFPPSRAS